MGIYIPRAQKDEIGQRALELAEGAVADYRQPGCHVIGYDEATVGITDGAEVRIIAIAYDRQRLKNLSDDFLTTLDELLEAAS